MASLGHRKERKKSFKKHAGSTSTSQIEGAKEEYCVAKSSKSKHKKIGFDEELEKQDYLEETQK